MPTAQNRLHSMELLANATPWQKQRALFQIKLLVRVVLTVGILAALIH